MPGLTVAEKEHWKERIGRRIDKKIETLEAAEPNLIERIEREAREQALVSLGLLDLQTEADRIERQRESLAKQQRNVERALLARVRGVPVEDLDFPSYQAAQEIRKAVERRQEVHEDELLSECDLGRQILALRSEKEGLLDCVWLASSPKQIKELWTQVAKLLGDTQTQLQRDAIAIEPIAD